MKRLPRLAPLLLLIAAACATNPVTGERELRLISAADEIAIGTENYAFSQQGQGGPYTVDPSVTAYVAEVGGKLAALSDRPDLPFEFVVLNNPVPNAWALPGGKIAVNRGLLTELHSEAELAAVLGHEIVHAAARHGARRMERGVLLSAGMAGLGTALGGRRGADVAVGGAALGAKLISSRYGRDDELESDRYGMDYMARAGYDPRAAVSLQETFVRLSEGKQGDWLSGLFASHPPSPERVARNRAHAAALPAGGNLGAEAYRARLSGLFATAPAYAAAAEGETALAADDPATALAKAREAIAALPAEAAFYTLKGRALLAADDGQGAADAFSEAIRRHDGYFLPFLLRGMARKDRGDAAGARADLGASLALLPTAGAHFALGEMDRDTGDADAAIAHFTAAAGEGEVGQRAALELARLELPRQPSKYIAVGADLDERGMVVVRVLNHAPLAVTGVELTVSLAGPGGLSSPPVRLRLDGPLGPGEGARLGTAIGPIGRELGAAPVRVLVTAARPR
ncbi:MAG: M48 family metalloprotease [Nitrospirae bacterium]|nr:M48 family metalloprotease [Nitrospirota bacterium]